MHIGPLSSGVKLGFGLAKLSNLLGLGNSPKNEPDPREEGIVSLYKNRSKEEVAAALRSCYIRRNETKQCLEGNYVMFCGHFKEDGSGHRDTRGAVTAVSLEIIPTIAQSTVRQGRSKLSKQTQSRVCFFFP